MDTKLSGLTCCRVCETPATGLHYGVITCEACKAFFRRGLVKGNVYECAEKRSCDISYASRNSCAYCRLQKCVKVGMSKEAIKSGRYSYELKTFTLPDVKRLSSRLKTDKKKAEDEIVKKSSSPLSNITCKEVDLNNNDINGVIKQKHSGNNGEELTIGSYNSELRVLLTTDECQGIPGLPRYNTSVMFQTYSNNNGLNACNDTDPESIYRPITTDLPAQELSLSAAVDRKDTSEVKLFDTSKIETYECIIQKLHDRHKSYFPEDIDMNQNLSKMEKEHLEIIELRKQVFGSLNPMSIEEYMSFFKETGIDVDGRREMMQQCVPLWELGLKQQIDFAKTIPGFRNLSIKDQIGLIKCSRLDYFMMSNIRSFNSEHQLCTWYGHGMVWHIDDWIKLEGEYVEPLFKLQRRIKTLNLTVEEAVILTALCIVSPDDCDLENAERVEQIQDFLLECLFYLFNKHHPHERLRFTRIINCLTELRVLREDNIKSEERTLSMWWGIINFPPLVHEMLT